MTTQNGWCVHRRALRLRRHLSFVPSFCGAESFCTRHTHVFGTGIIFTVMDDSLSLRRRLDPDILKKFYGSTLWGVVSPIYFIYFI